MLSVIDHNNYNFLVMCCHTYYIQVGRSATCMSILVSYYYVAN